MKKMPVVLLVVAVAVLVGACSSFQPVMASVSFPDNCEVLGRVSMEMDSNDAGFTLLLEKAKELYPDAEDVVNIVVDAKTTKSIFSTKYYYVMSGIAVKYNNQ